MPIVPTRTTPFSGDSVLAAYNELVNIINDKTSGSDPSNVNITGGNINGTAIGATTPSTGNFTTLQQNGIGVVTLSGVQTLTQKSLTAPIIAGGTINSAIIGGVTPAAGTFTSLTSSSLTTGGTIFNQTASPSYLRGSLVYDTGNEALTFFNNDSAVALQIGQESWTRVMNSTGSTITNGTPVYINGASGGLPTIAPAQANAVGTMVCAGLATEDIAPGAIGFVTSQGVVRGLNTAAFTAGQTVFLSAAAPGALVNAAPAAPNFAFRIGVVAVSDASVGSINVQLGAGTLGFGTANQLAGMTAAATGTEYKSLAVGTAGTNFTITHTANTITFDLPDASGTARGVFNTTTQTLGGNKTFTGQTTFNNATSPILVAKIGPAAGNMHAIPAVTSDTYVLLAAAQALTNKTLTAPTINVNDNAFTLRDNGDVTKTAQFELSGITTATLRTFTLPDASDTLVVLTANQTLTNKRVEGGTYGAGSTGYSLLQTGTLNVSAAGTGAANCMVIQNSNGVVGSIVSNGTTTTYGTSSDARMKDQIATMTVAEALAIVNQMRPVTYRWQYADGQPHGFGWLAQEVFPYAPDAVVQGDSNMNLAPTDPDFKMWGVDPGKMLAPVVTLTKQNTSDIAALQTANGRSTSVFTLTPSGSGATGQQVHATKDSTVRVTYSTQVTYSLTGTPTSAVDLKICATNNATEAAWATVGRTAIAQPTGLSVTIGQVVNGTGQIVADVPAGWYVKAVASGLGTHTEAFVAGQKTIYG